VSRPAAAEVDPASSDRPFVRTVLGDTDPAVLGVTNSHDHLFFRSPQLPGQELADPGAAIAEARAFAAAGGQTIVQWTPRGLGRHLDDLTAIAADCGLHIIAATGRHRAAHYGPDGAAEPVDRLAAAFVADVNRATGPCGIVKVGTGYHHLDEVERGSLEAAGHAHQATGVPVAIHLELGTAGDLVLGLLERHGVPPSSVVLGHVGRHPDDGYLLELAASGAFLCFDGPSRANHRTDWRTPACIQTLTENGHLDQVLVGGDTTTADARSVTSGPGMPGLLTRFGRAVRQRIGDPAWTAIVEANPARAFIFGRPPRRSVVATSGRPRVGRGGGPPATLRTWRIS
jgi:predicted metal-dependent phosphotriesterase family hydrolase